MRENGLGFWVDLRTGQKTGTFLDQRENRFALRRYARGREVLNCFSYTGGFSVNAAVAGAPKVLSLDSDGDAIALSRKGDKQEAAAEFKRAAELDPKLSPLP